MNSEEWADSLEEKCSYLTFQLCMRIAKDKEAKRAAKAAALEGDGEAGETRHPSAPSMPPYAVLERWVEQFLSVDIDYDTRAPEGVMWEPPIASFMQAALDCVDYEWLAKRLIDGGRCDSIHARPWTE